MDAGQGAHASAVTVRLLLLYSDACQVTDLFRAFSTDGYDVIACPARAELDAWVEEVDTDLVLLIPAAAVEEMVRQCEAARARLDAPIVVLGDNGDEGTIARALASGVDEYLVNPIGMRELDARLRAILRRAQRYASSEERRQIGAMTLSPLEHAVEYKGRRIFLSPIEFRLLQCLASAPGKVLTHQTLMSRVWGAEYVDSRHYLRVYIRYLREKIEDDPTNPRIILNEWGVGYRFAPPPAEGEPSMSR